LKRTAATGGRTRLLQESGYFVLRFLAVDVGQNLDFVLDAILACDGEPETVNRLSGHRQPLSKFVKCAWRNFGPVVDWHGAEFSNV
jgi:hypothetical protein